MFGIARRAAHHFRIGAEDPVRMDRNRQIEELERAVARLQAENIRLAQERGTAAQRQHTCSDEAAGAPGEDSPERLSEELRLRAGRAEKMEALGLLAGGVAHDGNNIISGIMGNIRLAMMELDKTSQEYRYLESALTLSRRLGELIQDLLCLARGGVSEQYRLNLNTVVKEFLSSGLTVKIRSLHPEVSIEAKLGGNLHEMNGRIAELEKLLLNLVKNAAEAMPDGGAVTITTSDVTIETNRIAYDRSIPPGEYVVLEIADTGLGIPPEDIGHVFEPFFSRKKMNESGSGLGLAVVYGTVKDHRGFIDLRSERGCGTVFTCYFPALPAGEPAPGTGPHPRQVTLSEGSAAG